MARLSRAQQQKIERDQARQQKEAVKKRAKQLILDGYSTQVVSKMVGADPSTVYRWARKEIQERERRLKNAPPKPPARRKLSKREQAKRDEKLRDDKRFNAGLKKISQRFWVKKPPPR
jgi:transposase